MTQPRDVWVGQGLRLFAGLVVQPFAAAALGFIAFPFIDFSGRALYGGVSNDPMDAALSIGAGAASPHSL